MGSAVTDTREALARALREVWDVAYEDVDTVVASLADADAVLAALAAAGKSIVDDPGWEWNVRDRDGVLMLNQWVSEDEARGWFRPGFGRTVIRRRPAGAEEVAPDV